MDIKYLSVLTFDIYYNFCYFKRILWDVSL